MCHHLVNGLIEPDGRLPADHGLDLADVRHAAGHVFKAGGIRLIVGNQLCFRVAAGTGQNAPGQIEDSELIDEIDPRLKGIMRDQSPLKRLVTYQEIADVVLLLCAGPFASMTGQTLTLDAGWSLPKWGYALGPVEWEDKK